MKNDFEHIPVMPNEVVEFLRPKENGIYVDATLGGGGHTMLIVNFLRKNGKIIGIDQDAEAIEMARVKLAKYRDKILYVCDNFRSLDNILDNLNIEKVDGILIDLGVSTYQLLKPERGFSFSENDANINARLDMRMNLSQELTAYDVVNGYDENQLRDIFFRLGEEPYGGRIAKKIVQIRKKTPIVTTNDLLNVIKSATPPKYRFSRKYGHYASKVFRAIRMEVNQELPALEEVIPKAIARLKSGGRLVVISFHSLEDRIVKRSFKEMALTKDDKNPVVKLLTKKPVVATEREISSNPKSDSAKLRAVEKL
ncbi:MAG: 16S rRNA (cytosine(1402)-N(4))-methyltransferase RsmH [bacterium]